MVVEFSWPTSKEHKINYQISFTLSVRVPSGNRISQKQ